MRSLRSRPGPSRSSAWSTAHGVVFGPARFRQPYAPYFREAVAGVPGKGTDMVTYQIQAVIDVAHAQQAPLSGQVMDITKAFDALPRPQVLQLCDRLGVPLHILRGWHGAMTLNQRRFFLDGAITPLQATERGVPQGCALSCLAMGAINLALCNLLHRTVPATLPALYADNWEVASPDEQVTHRATQEVDHFTRVIDVQLDQAKSHAWATTPAARKRLGVWGHRVVHSAPHLGHRISYTKRRSQKGLLARTPAPELWQYLRASLAAFGRKVQALRQVIWPRTAAPSVQRLHSCRAQAARALGYGLRGQNSWVVHNLLSPANSDPGLHVLQRAVMAFRRNMTRPVISGLFHQWLPFRHEKAQGVFTSLQDLLHRVGGVLWANGDVHITPVGPVALHQASLALVSFLLRHQWQQHVAHQLAGRFGVPPGAVMAPELSHLLLKQMDPRTQGLIRKVQAGTFYAGEHTAHFADTAQCRHCGAMDSIEHRLRSCPITEPARHGLPMQWTDWPRHLRHYLLPVLPPEVVQLHCLRRQVHPDIHTGPMPPPPRHCHLFTDGSASRHFYTPLTCAAWSVILAHEHDHYPVASGRLPGITQSPARAEAWATRCAAAHQVQVSLWTDCQPALQRVEQILQGQVPSPTWANYDVWTTLASPEHREAIQSVHKVHSHQRHEAREPGDLWAIEANEMADQQAAIARDAWLAGEGPLWHAAHDALQLQTERLRHLRNLHLVSAELYTGGSGTTNRPGVSPLAEPHGMPLPEHVEAVALPPSLRRMAARRPS